MKNWHFTLAAFATLMASCSNDETFAPQDNDTNHTPITISVAVGDPTSRAGYDASNLPGSFYLSLVQKPGFQNSPYNYSDVLMTKSTSDNTYSAPEGSSFYWYSAEQWASIIIKAYTSNEASFSIETDQSTADAVKSSDLLGAYGKTRGYGLDEQIMTDDSWGIDISNNGRNIDITLHHLLCKLQVTSITFGTEYSGAEVTGVIYNGFGSECSFDTDNVTVTGTAAGSINALLGTNADGNATAEAIFTPIVDNPTIYIYASVNGEIRTFTTAVTPPADGFKSGYLYTMSIKAGEDKVETTDITAANWINQDGGDLETE